MSKAIATRIGKSKNEGITYGDVQVRKAVLIGKYNFLCLFYLDNQETPHIGACGTRENAAKWTPGQTSRDIYAPKKNESDEVKAHFHNDMRDAKKKWGSPKQVRKYGYVFYRFTRSIRRDVLKIERS